MNTFSPYVVCINNHPPTSLQINTLKTLQTEQRAGEFIHYCISAIAVLTQEDSVKREIPKSSYWNYSLPDTIIGVNAAIECLFKLGAMHTIPQDLAILLSEGEAMYINGAWFDDHIIESLNELNSFECECICYSLQECIGHLHRRLSHVSSLQDTGSTSYSSDADTISEIITHMHELIKTFKSLCHVK